MRGGMKPVALAFVVLGAGVLPTAGAKLSSHRESIDVGPGEFLPATPECGPRQRIVSGGFEAPGFNQAGARVTVQSSAKRGRKRWSSAGDNFSPTFAGTLIAYAYCERRAPPLDVRSDSTPIFDLETATAHCGPGERLVSGGFKVPNREDNAISITRSHKKGQGWEVSGRVVSGSEVTLVAEAYCSSDAPRLKTVDESTPVAGNSRDSVTAPCPRGRPLASGGFVLSEPPNSLTVFRSRRAGRHRWRASAHSLAVSGGELTVEAYCGRP